MNLGKLSFPGVRTTYLCPLPTGWPESHGTGALIAFLMVVTDTRMPLSTHEKKESVLIHKKNSIALSKATWSPELLW